ncbi:MAG TPA: hypothetical protein VF905_00155 [Nitrospirota bacterium]
MPLSKGLQPVRSIHDGTDLPRLCQLAPPYLHSCLIGKGGSIRQPGEIGEMTHMDLSFSISAALLLWFADGHRARFCPLLVDQRNHGPIRTKSTTWRCWLLGRFLRGSRIVLLCLSCFHVRSQTLAELADRLLVGLHTQDLFDHLGGFVERHPTRQVGQMFLLSGSETAWQ